MIQILKRYFFPGTEPSVKKLVDVETVNNIYFLSFFVMLFELLTFCFYLFTAQQFTRSTWISAGSVLFCVVACLGGYVTAGRIRKKDSFSHCAVTVFKIACYIVLSVWAIWVSYRQYNRGEQLLTFFAVEMMTACFIPFRPWVGTMLTMGVYAGLFVTLYQIDGAAQLNIFNYLVLAFVSVIGQIVLCHSQIRMAEKTIQLKKNNDMLEYMNRHDVLTQLRNRKALEEDAVRMAGGPVCAYMIDVDSFKEINDVYGHRTGDEVLRETARELGTLFPLSYCYRFGGDEFLVLSERGRLFKEDTHQFSAACIPGKQIHLSIGIAEGLPTDPQQVFELIVAADMGLYAVKRKIHSPEFGGHDRRHNRES